ncbi:MAG TPA: hypothetical protein VH143_26640 [Kofleriaceae bacterium]|nr:hypothetical protein [Kofleriaceae bacterium]
MKTHCPAVGVPHVEPCDPVELAPLIAWLARGEPCAEPIAFPRGTVLPDGRLDLCKQSVGPEGARRVLDAARGHPAIRSILLETGAIGDAGAASPIGDNIDTLHAGCNRITDAGVRALSRTRRVARCALAQAQPSR